MKRRMTCQYALCVLVSWGAMAVAQVVPGDRLHLEGWRNAGYPGGIPTPDVIVNVKTYGALGDGSACDAAVSSAISALGGGAGVVFFPAGTYLLQNALTLPSGVVLRGERSTNTLIQFSCDGNCITAAGSLSGNSQVITSGYTNHSTTLMVPDGSAFHAGDFIDIKESNDPTYSWSTWAIDVVGQMSYVTAVTGNVLTLQTPLRLTYQASLTPTIQKSVPTTQVGIENLKLERLNAANYVTDNKMTVLFDRAADCWMRGVELYNGFGGHVGFYTSTRISIIGCYMHHAWSYSGGGNGYGVRLESKTGEVLVQDNVFYSLRHSVLIQVAANGNVVGYNYSSGGAANLSDMTSHGNFPFANLIEGNICEYIQLDDSHYESGPHNTFLRNLCTKSYASGFGYYSGGLLVTQSGTSHENFVGNEASGYHFDGTDQFTYGNNINGTILTSGTTNLPDISYYLGQNVASVATPAFWFITNTLPTIGLPNVYGTGKTNPARYRNDQGLSRTVAPPSLWLQPSNVTIAAGSGLTLSIQATGTPVAVFQWYRGGQSLAGATSNVYQVGSAQAGDAGQYQCAISDSYGAISSRVATVTVTGGATGTVDFVQAGATWRYFNTGLAPTTNWYAKSFDDSTWSNGPAPLGYGDPAIATTLGYGGVDSDKWVTIYFRKAFTVANVGAVTGVNVRLIADDAARFYLNGKLLYGTTNLAATVSNNTYALGSVLEPYVWTQFTVNPSELLNGTNEAAVELHQVTPGTSDAYLDLAIEPGAYVTTNESGSAVVTAPSTTTVNDAWVAYNDLGWQSGETTNRITLYTYNQTGGPLMDFNTGTQLTAHVDMTTNEALGIFGVADATPMAGSDADFYFTSRTDPRGYLQGFVTLSFRFSNLNPAALYSCVFYGNRGPVYTDRFTDVTISDATSFENQSSLGAQKLTSAMANDTTRILTGSNTLGQVVRFASINPGSDGDFVVTATRALGGNAYVNAFMIAAGAGDPLTDANGNGMADSWEIRHFGATNSVQGQPNADGDGDGMNNSDEFRAGTDPASAASVFRIESSVPASNGATTFGWTSVPGKSYSIEASSNMALPWSVLQTSVTAAPPMNVVTTPPVTGQEFIRVRVD